VLGLTRAIEVVVSGVKPTQTAPFRAARPAGFEPTSIRRTTLSVRGSTTASLPSPQVVTQTRPKATSTLSGLAPTAILFTRPRGVTRTSPPL